MSSSVEAKIKFIIIGDQGIGKTSLCQTFITDEYQDSHGSTIGVDYLSTTVQINDGDSILLELWDTAGQERFHSLSSSFYQQADGVIIALKYDK